MADKVLLDAGLSDSKDTSLACKLAAILGGQAEGKEVVVVSEQQGALVGVLAALARQRPLVLAVEDCGHLGAGTVMAMSYGWACNMLLCELHGKVLPL